METTTTTKVCKKCGRELPIEQFHKNNRLKDGHQTYCKECESIANKKRYAKRKNNCASVGVKIKDCPPANPKFADKTPRELQQDMRELKEELIARGFEVNINLKYTYSIIL